MIVSVSPPTTPSRILPLSSPTPPYSLPAVPTNPVARRAKPKQKKIHPKRARHLELPDGHPAAPAPVRRARRWETQSPLHPIGRGSYSAAIATNTRPDNSSKRPRPTGRCFDLRRECSLCFFWFFLGVRAGARVSKRRRRYRWWWWLLRWRVRCAAVRVEPEESGRGED